MCAFVCGFGRSIEAACERHEWPTNPLKCLTAGGGRRNCSTYVRQALQELPMSVVRNQYRATALLRHLGFGIAAHRSWVDQKFMRQYLFSFRARVIGSSYAYASDKSRGAGKDWLSGNMGTYESKTFGWCNPVAIFEISRPPPPQFEARFEAVDPRKKSS